MESYEGSVTIVANQSTQANVRANKYFKEATITVKVNEAEPEFAVKQTGANKITVTGKDLTDNTADYVVKRGSTVVTLKSVASLNETKTEAVLEASATNLVAGTYTLSFKEGDAFEFPVEAAAVASIEILSDVAVLASDSTTQATARYQVLNQFGEDITANSTLAAPGSRITISGSNNAEAKSGNPGIVTFSSGNTDFRLNVDVVVLTIVCNANGVNAQKTLTVSNKAVLDTAEFVGIYMTNKSGVLEKVDLKEKTSKKDLEASYYALFSGKDQYGVDYTEGTDLNVIISGLPGLLAQTGDEAVVSQTVDNVKYLAVKLTAAYDNLHSGTCDVMAIPTMSGKTSTATIDVAAVAKIDTVAITTVDVLGGEENSLGYDIIDTEGNPVTSYDVIANSGIFYDENGNPKIERVKVERKDDGVTANIIYTAESNDTENDKIATFTIMSETNKVTLVQLNVQSNPVPTTIKAVNKIESGKNLSIISGNSVTIKVENLTILDQHGNEYSLDKISDTNKVKIKVESGNGRAVIAGNAVTAGGVEVTGKSIELVTITGSGVTDTIKFSIVGKDEGACTLNLTSRELSSVDNNVIIEVPALMYQGTEDTITVKTADGAKLEPGNGETAGQYSILNDYRGTELNMIRAPKLATGPSVEVTEKTFTITVTVNGKDYKQEVKYSNADPVVAKASAANPKISAAAVSSTGITFGDLQKLLTVTDQYGSTTSLVATDSAIRANVVKVGTNNAVISNNNTDKVVISGVTANDIFEVTYTFKNSTYTFKTRVTVGE